MKILYIDNRRYGHNADLHIRFIQYMQNKGYHNIYAYGDNMKLYFKRAYVPNKNNLRKDFYNVLRKANPDIILTYNCNGSSYEIGYDNISLYKWIAPYLAKTDLPKFHITTDYCRSGFREEQAKWFEDIGYTAAFFRHKVALNHPINVPAFWLPFSIDQKIYKKNLKKNISRKEKRVGFIGAAHNSSHSLYAHRIAAFDFLDKKNLLAKTPIINQEKGTRAMYFNDEYVRFWTRHVFGLTCGGTCNFMTAKYFQIPAAYSMLICTKTEGLDLFPKNTYITYSKNNLEKLHSDIIWHLKNYSDTRNKIRILNEYVLQNHNHDARIKRFTKRINKLI